MKLTYRNMGTGVQLVEERHCGTCPEDCPVCSGREMEEKNQVDGIASTMSMPTLETYAIVFEKDSRMMNDWLGPFIETIDRACIIEPFPDSDVRALYSHNAAELLGRTSNGSLVATRDDYGMKYSVTPPNVHRAWDLVTMVRGKYIQGASFGFIPRREVWSWDRVLEIERVRVLSMYLAEVSFVGDPAYPDTTASVRSREMAIRRGEYTPPEHLASLTTRFFESPSGLMMPDRELTLQTREFSSREELRESLEKEEREGLRDQIRELIREEMAAMAAEREAEAAAVVAREVRERQEASLQRMRQFVGAEADC